MRSPVGPTGGSGSSRSPAPAAFALTNAGNDTDRLLIWDVDATGFHGCFIVTGYENDLVTVHDFSCTGLRPSATEGLWLVFDRADSASYQGLLVEGAGNTSANGIFRTVGTSRFVSSDGAAAGGSAAARSLDTFLDRGFEVPVAAIPGGMDPDDFLRNQGVDAYDALVREAPGYLDFLIDREAGARDLGTVAGKVEAVNALLPRLAGLPNAIERAAWAGKIAGRLGIEDELVLQELRGALRQGKTAIRQQAETPETVSALEGRILALLLRDPTCRARAREGLDPSDLDPARVAPIVQTILGLEGSGATVDGPSVVAALEDEDARRSPRGFNLLAPFCCGSLSPLIRGTPAPSEGHSSRWKAQHK